MNKRIQELAEEAWSNLDNDPQMIFSSADVKRFAELIVQECVRHFNEDYKRDFMVSWREDLSNSILNNFGIKE